MKEKNGIGENSLIMNFINKVQSGGKEEKDNMAAKAANKYTPLRENKVAEQEAKETWVWFLKDIVIWDSKIIENLEAH